MVRIHRIGIFSLGKVSAILYALFGLLGGLLMSAMSLLSMIFSGSSRSAYSSYSSYGGSSSIIGIVTGLGAIVCLPILYGVMGFIGGIISAFFMNLALKYAGGLEIEAVGFSLQPASPKIEPISPLPQ
ncbi:MAG: hypothetical protein WBM17_10935 [Anaerolineales bacterium]